jgi:hypothetical protein
MHTSDPHPRSLPTIDLDRLATVSGGGSRLRPITSAVAGEWRQLRSSVTATATETWKSVCGLFHF